MPQIQLPIFPEGVTHITAELAYSKRDGQVVYFNGQMPVFMHAEGDLETFRMITSQFVINGSATQSEIVAAFGVPKGTVKRYVKLYREKGPKGFYASRKTRRGPTVLTAEILERVQARLNEGEALGTVACEMGLKTNTLNKAIHAGKLVRRDQKKVP